jgi:hypothetical protein
MSRPRYRTLDGEELELPLAMDRWVLVPRGLARFDPELAWALDYEDAPQPEDADPRLDFSAGALLVPVDRWNEHAELEPNLAPCRAEAPESPRRRVASAGPTATVIGRRGGNRSAGAPVARLAARGATLLLAALATSYVLAVGGWLWSLRDGISGPNVSTGVMLIGVAVLLAWLTGLVGAGSRRVAARGRTWVDLGASVVHATDDPLAILRLGLAVQVTGFAVLVILR